MTPFADASRRAQVARLGGLGKAALSRCGRPDARLKLLHHGHNTVFRVDDGAERLVLRVCRPGWNSEAALRSELDLLRFLDREGVPVTEPVGEGLALAAHPGVPEPRFCTLMRYRDGRHVRPPTIAACRTVGALLARLHALAARFAPPKGFERPVWDADGLLRDFPGSRMEAGLATLEPEQRERIAAAEIRMRADVGRLPRTPETFGLIHADLHFNNCLFHRGQTIPIDWDDCGLGWFAYDLAVLVTSLERWPDAAALQAAVAEGYGGFSPELTGLVEVLSYARRLALARWLCGLLEEPGLGPRLRPMIDRLVASLDA